MEGAADRTKESGLGDQGKKQGGTFASLYFVRVAKPQDLGNDQQVKGKFIQVLLRV